MRQVAAGFILLIVGLLCAAQVPMTGAGPGGSVAASGCSFPSLTGLVGRWNALNVTTSGANIATVTELSGSGASDLTPTNTVPYNATGYNSKPTLDFKTANSAALSSASFPMGTGGTGSIFIVGQMLTATAAFGGAVVYGVTGDDFGSLGNLAIITRNNTANQIDTTGSFPLLGIDTSVSLATNYRLGVIIDGSNVTQYINNSAGNSSTQIGGRTWGNNGTFVVGNRFLSGAVATSNPWEGPISEIVVGTGDWTGTQQNDLDAYFTCQWGTWLFERDLDAANDNVPMFLAKVA